MIHFALPPPDAAEPPAFTSAHACRAWLAGVPLTNPPHAQALLLHQTDLLNHSFLPGEERLQILELLREPIGFVQNECARRFVAKPLPLADSEQATYAASQALWQGLATNYLHCLQICVDLRNNSDAALIAQRALAVTGAALKDACRAGILPAAGHWRRLHQIYRAAEELQVTQDPISHGKTVTETYLAPLLIAAAHPFELSPRQFALVANWAQRWSGKVAVLAASPVGMKAPPLIVDLAGEQPAAFKQGESGELTAEWRWLELSDLRKSLKKRLTRLARGESPESLQLGKECAQPDCEALLKQVYRFWCKGDSGESVSARCGATCRLVGGMEAIHYYLSGQKFRQPGEAITLSKCELDEIATFGRIATRHKDDYGQQAVETWQLLEENTAELRLTRPLGQPGLRLCSDQLVAVQPDNSPLMLGVVRWVASRQETLTAGVHLLPGKPVAVALRGTGITALNEKFSQGFRLPAVLQLWEPASVVMPKGYFRAGRIIEIYTDHARQIHLERLLERGANFERADFAWT